MSPALRAKIALETKRAAKAAAASVQAINRQAAIMERQTTALIASERTWIDGELIHTEQLGFHRYSLTITNHGKTPAQVRSFRINSGALQEGTKFSPSALANEKTQNLDAFLGAGEPKNLLDGIDMDEMFSGNANDADFATCGAYCVLITYADVIQRSEHETFFVYHYKPLVRSLSRISVENRYT